MNQRRGRRRKLADALAAELRLLPYHRDKMAGLPSQTRYTFALMANIFHEVLLLERLIARSEPGAGVPEYIKGAQVAQSMMLVRMLGAKVWEADIRLGADPAATQLRDVFLPLVGTAGEEWVKLRANIAAAKWLGRLRSAHAFHYPKYSQIGTHLDERWVHGGGTIIGDALGNTLHYEADQALMLALFASMLEATGEPIPTDSRELVQAFDRILGEVYTLSGQLSTLLGEVLFSFVKTQLMGDAGAEIRPIGDINGPDYAEFFLPFFMRVGKRP